MKKPMPMKPNKMKMRMGAPVAKAASGGFLKGMSEGLGTGFDAGSKGRTKMRDRELAKKGGFAKDTIYARTGGMVGKGMKKSGRGK
jgi:hypothetical protein